MKSKSARRAVQPAVAFNLLTRVRAPPTSSGRSCGRRCPAPGTTSTPAAGSRSAARAASGRAGRKTSWLPTRMAQGTSTLARTASGSGEGARLVRVLTHQGHPLDKLGRRLMRCHHANQGGRSRLVTPRQPGHRAHQHRWREAGLISTSPPISGESAATESATRAPNGCPTRIGLSNAQYFQRICEPSVVRFRTRGSVGSTESRLARGFPGVVRAWRATLRAPRGDASTTTSSSPQTRTQSRSPTNAYGTE